MAAEIDGPEESDPKLLWHILGYALNKIDRWQIGAMESYESIGRRVVARVADMSPELVEGKGQSDLVAKLGGERASLSYWKKDFEKHFGVHFRPGKTLHACRAYSAARQQKVKEKKEQTEQQRESLLALLKKPVKPFSEPKTDPYPNPSKYKIQEFLYGDTSDDFKKERRAHSK
jgi:hypothetical protein